MTAAPLPAGPLVDLRARLPALTLRDEHRLARRLDGLRRVRDADARAAALAQVADEVAAAEARVARRRASVPAVSYPEELPVSARREDLLAALGEAQVVVVAGETGSGKTTQLPKLLLELGRGVRGTIAHTQPRRIAARSTAARVAEELGVPLGAQVGYTHRFDDRSTEDTLVRLMTDGVLLAEIGSDRMLRRYDTVVVDEAHERSLSIDFLLGYLTQLLPRRPDLKVVITSATIETSRFADHFGGAPVVEVSGRTYPVEVRYRPLVEDAEDDSDGAPESPPAEDPDDDRPPRRGRERDLGDAVGEAVEELVSEGPGDVLVFLAGERDIRDVTSSLEDRPRLRGVELLPLFGRLSAGEQSRVFAPSGRRRVVLATNVAETSLTVPGIRYVVDAGTARVSRYSRRTKVQRLPIEPISQASAQQRAGRCGRVADGIAIRLYSEDDYLGRPEQTEPEVLRTNLASVLLQMASLGLGDVAAFPFVDPPDRRAVSDGVAVLEELGAFDPAERDPRRRLTPLGRSLARLPVDPRLARMVLAARDEGCVAEVLVVAAALSIQDPRERPSDAQAAADASHARFAEPGSDVVTLLNLWRYLSEQRQGMSGGRFRRMCREEYLHASRVREWQDLHAQLRRSAEAVGVVASGPVAVPTPADAVHRAVLSGLLANVGRKDTRDRKGRDRARGVEYDGARGARFALWPGSVLAGAAPRFVVAAELVETSRLFARTAARIEPEWAERLGAHLVKRSYSEPHWSAERGAVVASETVTLYGVPLVTGRRVGYSTVDPALCRDLFLRHALVAGEWRSGHHAFWQENQRRLSDLGALQDRTRRSDLEVDEEALVHFYDARVPADVLTVQDFDRWWRGARRTQPDRLLVDVAELLGEDARVDPRAYPDVWRQGDLRLPLTYRFAPGEPDDGVSVDVALPLLPQLDGTGFAWHVPGFRRDLVEALLRQLPKELRVPLVPVPDTAAALVRDLSPSQGPLPTALSAAVRRLRDIDVPPAAWRLDRVPDHLRLNVRAVDADGRVVGAGRDVPALRTRLAAQVRAALSAAAAGVERTGVRTWDLGRLPSVVEVDWHGTPLRVRPTLVDQGDSVAVRVVPSEAEQARLLRLGVRRLVLLAVPNPTRSVLASLSTRDRLALAVAPHGDVPALLEDCVTCAADALLAEVGTVPTDEHGFARLVAHVRPRLGASTAEVLGTVRQVLAAWWRVRERTGAVEARAPQAAADVSAQVSRLVHPGFATATGRRRLRELPRYLRAVEVRLERLAVDPARDASGLRHVQEVEQAYRRLRALAPTGSPEERVLEEVRWALEELRVNVFAPTLPTPFRVSEARIRRTLQDVERGEVRRRTA